MSYHNTWVDCICFALCLSGVFFFIAFLSNIQGRWSLARPGHLWVCWCKNEPCRRLVSRSKTTLGNLNLGYLNKKKYSGPIFSNPIHITFTLQKVLCPPVFLNQTSLPTVCVVCYIGIYMDKKLTWNPHTRLKRTETNRRYKMLIRLLDSRSRLTLNSKILIYNTFIKPLWT